MRNCRSPAAPAIRPDGFNPLDECQRIAELDASRVGQRRRHQRVRDGIERRLRREGDHVVIEGSGLQLLTRGFVETRDPVVDDFLAPGIEPAIGASELIRRPLRDGALQRQGCQRHGAEAYAGSPERQVRGHDRSFRASSDARCRQQYMKKMPRPFQSLREVTQWHRYVPRA
jgi:hypothetical protein